MLEILSVPIAQIETHFEQIGKIFRFKLFNYSHIVGIRDIVIINMLPVAGLKSRCTINLTFGESAGPIIINIHVILLWDSIHI